MATKVKRAAAEQPLPAPPGGDWRDLADRIAENPLLYIGAILFVVVAGIAGWLIRMYQVSVDQEFATEYARALDQEDDAAVVTALEPLADEKPVALYMLAENAYKAGELDKAKEAYTRMREKYPESPYAADAVEGLGFIAELNGNYDEAKGFYQDVLDSWPDSFAAKRQQFNIGRCEEAAGNTEAAIDAYRAQTLAFPNSRVAARANSQLAMLQAETTTTGSAESDVENALNAVLESTGETEETPAEEPAVDAEITEMPVDVIDAPPVDTEKLELTLPEPGAGAGAVDMEEAEDAEDPAP